MTNASVVLTYAFSMIRWSGVESKLETYAFSMIRWSGVESKLDDDVALQTSGKTINLESPDSTRKPKYIFSPRPTAFGNSVTALLLLASSYMSMKYVKLPKPSTKTSRMD